MSFLPLKIILVKPAAALVANSPYTLSNTAAGDIPTATITGVQGRPDIFVGKAAVSTSTTTSNFTPGEFWNATPGKSPNDPFVAGDTYAVVLMGFPIATLRTSAAITEGVTVSCAASGQIATTTVADSFVVGRTIGAQPTAGGLVDVLVDVRPNNVVITGTLAALGTAAAAGAGARRFVTDASTTLTLGIGTAITGGGANFAPAHSNGTNWIYG